MVAALYRRYRPEAFAEMIGQSQVTDPLMTALRTGRIGHAYLFSGPRGCGKTTSARILARCLNCAEGPTDTPCGVCPSCVELSRDGGGSLDVVEIDAASHGGVDDARDLRERAVFAPARDRFKIFIIDEAHMVTPGGFNALLKIVEEPPPHVKFVFATTEPDKVIGTIRSRTHHYPFRLIAPATLIDYVQTMCDSEGVQVEPGVLPLVVRAGGGSVRDTLSILDQLIAGSETPLVTADRAAGLLGFTHTELLDDVVAAFGLNDPAAAFQATDRVVQTGQDPRRFVEDLLERLRDLIVVGATTVDGAAAVFRGVPEDQLTRMFEQAQRFGRGQLSRIADVVSAALDQMAGATAPRLQLELMIARVLVQTAAPVDAGSGSGGAAVPQSAAPAALHPGTQSVTGQAGRGAPAAPAAAAPAPAQNPLSAVAAARSAATAPGAPGAPTQSPAAQAPAQAPAQTPTHAPAQATPAQPAAAAPAAPQPPAAGAPAAASTAADAPVPNAAQTAASIRDFLREEDGAGSAPPAASGTAPVPPVVAQDPAPAQAAPAATAGAPAAAAGAPAGPASAGPAPAADPAGAAEPGTPAPGTSAPDAAAPTPAASAPAAPAPAAPAAAAPAAAAPAAAAPAAAAAPGGAPHPNAGVAAFGRPITDILSAAQVESIGEGPAVPAPAAAPTPAAADPAAATPPHVAPAAPALAGGTAGGAPADPSAAVDTAADADAPVAGFEDLVELWPELLEELLEGDRDAWNAVRPVTPLALDGDVLTVGLATQSDLAAFKAAGAGPLRETILSAVGISVKYKPTRVAPGTAPEAQSTAREPRPDADAEEPHRGPASEDPNDPVARATARLNGLGPALTAPAWADPPPAPPAAAVPLGGAASGPPAAAVPTVPSVPHAPAQSAPATPSAPAAPSAPQASASPSTAPHPSVPQTATPPTPVRPGSAPGAGSSPGTAPGAGSAPGGGSSPAPGTAPHAGPPAEPPLPADPFADGDPYSEADAAPSGGPDDDAYGSDDPYAAGDPGDRGPAGGGGGSGPDPSWAARPGAPTSSGTAQAAPAPPQAHPAAAGSAGAPDPAGSARPTGPMGAAGSSDPAPSAPSAPSAPGTPPAPTPQSTPQSTPDGKRSAPAFTRYGEAVVREVLGARFIEELPLPPR